ncbi:hypothetical protein C8F04DRAFT_1273277 [Mycena alexandri]|uniref:Uncharacterized protein n=1 Tax=Mycena alexandri TaxID=1745969 RepID=A0AAD6S703_9AGAR|nr:hypothetical protein C8F04DRAFT_1273277 [Mycena alexandri]
MIWPTCGHPSELWPNPPSHYVSCTTLCIGKRARVPDKIALAITHLPAHADTDLHIDFFDTPRHTSTDMATALNTLPAIPCVCSTPPAPSNAVQNATTAAAHTTKTMCTVSDVLAHAKENVRAANQMLHVFCIQGEPTPHTGHDTRCVGFAAHSPWGVDVPLLPELLVRHRRVSIWGHAQLCSTRLLLASPPFPLPPPRPHPRPSHPPPNLERPHINDNDAHRDEDEDDGLISRMSNAPREYMGPGSALRPPSLLPNPVLPRPLPIPQPTMPPTLNPRTLTSIFAILRQPRPALWPHLTET